MLADSVRVVSVRQLRGPSASPDDGLLRQLRRRASAGASRPATELAFWRHRRRLIDSLERDACDVRERLHPVRIVPGTDWEVAHGWVATLIRGAEAEVLLEQTRVLRELRRADELPAGRKSQVCSGRRWVLDTLETATVVRLDPPLRVGPTREGSFHLDAVLEDDLAFGFVRGQRPSNFGRLPG